MNRDDFEWLWSISSFYKPGFIPGPPDMEIDSDLWEELTISNIIGPPINSHAVLCPIRIPIRSYYLPEKEIHSEPFGGKICNLDHPFDQLDDSEYKAVILPNGDRIPLYHRMCTVYPVSKIKLAQYACQKWNIRDDVRIISDIFPTYEDDEDHFGEILRVKEPILIGWKGNYIGIVLANDVAGVLDYYGLEEVRCSLNCQTLYFVLCQLGDYLIDSLAVYEFTGVVCFGLSEFLSVDLSPIWLPSHNLDGNLEMESLEKIPNFRYSDGFSQIEWNDEKFTQTRLQAKVISVLFDAYEDGLPQLYQERVLDRVGSKSKRLEHLFKKSPLWGKLIIPGDKQGHFQLKI